MQHSRDIPQVLKALFGLVAASLLTAATPGGPTNKGAGAISIQQTGELLDAHAEQLAFAPDGQTWVSGEQRTIGVYRGLSRVRQLQGVWLDSHDTLTFSADGKRLLAGFSIYDFAAGTPRFSGSADKVTGNMERGWAFSASRLSPDGTQLLAWLKYHPSECCREGSHRDGPTYQPPSPITVISTADGKSAPLLLGEGNGVGEFRALAVSERFFMVGGVTDKAYAFDRKTLRLVATLKTQTAYYDFQFTPDGSTLLGVHLGRELVVYDTAGFKQRAAWTVLPDGQWISAMALHPRLPVVAVSGWDKKLRLYSYAPGEEGRPLALLELGQASAMVFSPSGEELLVAVAGYPHNRIVRLAMQRK